MLDDEMVASVARALGHPARIRILRLLAAQTECRGADLFGELPLAQSTISEHLRVLKDAGLVVSRAEGSAMAYCIVPSAFGKLSTAIAEMTRAAPTCAPSGCGTLVNATSDSAQKGQS